MLSKKQLLVKSIRELLALNVSNEEITLNLKEVGVKGDEARRLIGEAMQDEKPAEKTMPVEKIKFIEKEKPVEKEKPAETKSEEKENRNRRQRTLEAKAEKIEAEREKATEELASEIVEPVEETISPDDLATEITVEKKPKKAPEPKTDLGYIVDQIKASAKQPTETSPKPVVEAKIVSTPPVADLQVSELWEKGILATINNRLSEMKELKEEIDSALDKKVAEANKREMAKIKVLLDSQRLLLVSKVDSELEVKAKGFAEMIELKLREMKEINKEISEEIEKFKQAENRNKVNEQALSEKLAEVDQIKKTILSSLNTELIKTRSESREISEKMDKKLEEMDDRINKTLQLENQIVEGLMKETEKKMAEMLEKKKAHIS